MLQYAAQLLPQDKGSTAQVMDHTATTMQTPVDPYQNLMSENIYSLAPHPTLDIWSTLVDSTNDNDDYDSTSAIPEPIQLVEDQSHQLYTTNQSQNVLDQSSNQSHCTLEDSGVAHTLISRDCSPESNDSPVCSLSGSFTGSPLRGNNSTPRKCRLAAKFNLPMSPSLSRSTDYQ